MIMGARVAAARADAWGIGDGGLRGPGHFGRPPIQPRECVMNVSIGRAVRRNAALGAGMGA